MPNLPISGLPSALTMSDGNLLEIVQDTGGGTLDNFKVTTATLRTFFQGTLPTSITDLETEVTGYTDGSVIFSDTDGTFTEDNTNFKWDNTGKVLRIGSSENLKLSAGGIIDGIIGTVPSPEADRAKMVVRNSNGTDGFATWVYIDEDGYTYESREASLRPLTRMTFDKNVGKTNLTELFGGERIEKLEFNSVNVIETIDFAVRKSLTSSDGTTAFQTATGATTADKLTSLNNWIMGGASIGTEVAPVTGQDFQLLITCDLYGAWQATGFVKIEVRVL